MRKRVALILLVLLLLAVSIPLVVTLRPAEEPTVPPPPETAPPTVPPGEDAPPPVAAAPEASRAKASDPTFPTEADAAPRRGSRDAGGAGEEPDPGFFGMLSGTVVDIRTGDPIVGAKIDYGPFPSSWGTKTNAKGWFSIGINSGPPTGRTWQIRVTATGYETWTAVPASESLRVELIPVGYVYRPGRIKGRALDRDGRPLTGVVRIVLVDAGGSSHYLAVQAGESGEFLLDGIGPGGCRIRHLNGASVDVFVAEDSETPVTIRSKRTREQLDRTVKDAKKLEFLKVALASVREAYELEKARGAGPAVLGRLKAQVESIERRVENTRSTRGRREVRVTGIPAPNGTRLVCESNGGSSTERWWTVVRNGEARFPALYQAPWTLTLKLTSGDVVADATVGEKGDVVFTPRKVKPTTEPR